MSTTNNQHYAVSDNSVAIAYDSSNMFNLICVYPILTSNNATERKTVSNPFSLNKNPESLKKFRYADQRMDAKYSSRYVSLSRDGHYLAISWLPNPRLGENNSMKYCLVFDLLNKENGIVNGKVDDEHCPVATPFAFFEFYGGCAFTNDGKLVLINDSKAAVHLFKHNEASNNIAIQPVSVLHLDSLADMDSAIPTYDLSPFIGSESKKNTTIINDPIEDSFDDIFFDEEDIDHMLLDDDLELNNEQEILSTEFETERRDRYHAFTQNDQFIRWNITNISHYGTICVILPDTDNNETLCVWSCKDNKIIYTKTLEAQQRDDLKAEYLTAFTKNLNMVAFTKKHNMFDSLPESKDPLFQLYDCQSGINLGRFYLPRGRATSGVTQLHFLQNDIYIMTVTHGYFCLAFDIWDVDSTTHLVSRTVTRDDTIHHSGLSQFIVHPKVQLKYGCGVYFKVELITSNRSTLGEENKIINDSYQTTLQMIDYLADFNDLQSSCSCGKTPIYQLRVNEDCKYFSHQLKPFEQNVTYNELNRAASTAKKVLRAAFFLDRKCTHLMVCRWDPSVGRNCLTMLVWRVTTERRKNCFHVNELHINMDELVYSFVLNRKEFQEERTYSFLNKKEKRPNVIGGHPTVLVDCEAIQFSNDSVTPMIISENQTTILVLELNHKTKRDLAFDFFGSLETAHLEKPEKTVMIPLHKYKVLEYHLHGLANEAFIPRETTVTDTIKYKYRDYTNMKKRIKDNYTLNKASLLDLIGKNLNYFSTLSGYTALSRLAGHDEWYPILAAVFTEKAKINYCSIAFDNPDSTNQLTNPLHQALTQGAYKNAALIIKHIRYSVTKYGAEYGTLLSKHHALIMHHLSDDFHALP